MSSKKTLPHKPRAHHTKAVPNRVGVRRRMSPSTFAVPEDLSYPIPDPYHAELALGALLRVAGRRGVTQEGRRTAREVLLAVHHRFPHIYDDDHETVRKIIRRYHL